MTPVKTDIIIISPTFEERDSVRNIKQFKFKQIQDDIPHCSGVLKIKGKPYELLLFSSGVAGPQQAQSLLHRILLKWTPRYLFLVGVSGGFKDRKVKIGDLILPREIISIESLKKTPSGEAPTTREYTTSKALLDAADGYYRSKWRKKTSKWWKEPSQCFSDGKIISSIILQANDSSAEDAISKIKEANWKVYGIEQESSGVAICLEGHPTIKWLDIRVVMDHADAKTRNEAQNGKAIIIDKNENKRKASEMAARFCYDFLKHYLTLSESFTELSVIRSDKFQLPARVVNFTGREVEIEELLVSLRLGKVLTLWAPSGTGKTALATEALYRLHDDGKLEECFPDGVIYHNFYNQPEIASAIIHIIRSYDENAQDFTPSAALRLLSGKRALLFFDGTEEADNLKSLLEIRGKCGVLITTQNKSDIIEEKQDVDPLPLEKAVELLRSWSGKETDVDMESATEICGLIGCLPMAICLVGKYLNQTGESESDYLKWLNETPLKALDPDESPHHLESVPVLMERSLSHVGERAKSMLGLIGRLAYSPFQPQAIGYAIEFDDTSLRRGLKKLLDFGFVQRVDKRFIVSHSLVHVYARSMISVRKDDLSRLAEYYTDFVSYLSEKGLEGYLLLDSERNHVMRLLEACMKESQWDVVLPLVGSLDDYLDIRGYWIDWVKALSLALSAAMELKDRQGESSCYTNLGVAYGNLGDFKKDIDYHEKSLEIKLEIGDRQGESKCYTNLGVAYGNLGDFKKAIDHYEKSLKIDPNDERILLAKGMAHHRLNQYEAAIQCYESVLTKNPTNDIAQKLRSDAIQELKEKEKSSKNSS